MNVKTFIDRPIFAGVISVMILLVGLIGLSQLPVEQFPEIAPPTVSVSATYAGANAETVQKSVLVPLEEAINGCILYKGATPSFMGEFAIDTFSGLSMYLPSNGHKELNKYYRTLKWNKATGLVK